MSKFEFDIVAAATAQAAGVNVPIAYPVEYTFNGQQRKGTAQPLLDVALSELDRDMSKLTQPERIEMQRHQVVDWVLGNPDLHRGQFVVLRDGTLVAVDKSQALRFFPFDALSWTNLYWPLNNRQSAYQYLYDGAAVGSYNLDPNDAKSFAAQITALAPAKWILQVWRPVFDDWTLARLIASSHGSAAVRPGRAINSLLGLLVNRWQDAEREFHLLYYNRSNGVW